MEENRICLRRMLWGFNNLVYNTLIPEPDFWGYYSFYQTQLLNSSGSYIYIFLSCWIVCVCLTSTSTNRSWIQHLLCTGADISAWSSHPDPLCLWGITTNIWWCQRIIRKALLLCISRGDRYLINTEEFYIILWRWILVHGTNEYFYIAFLQFENSNAMYYKKINHFVIMVFFGSKPVYWIPLVSSNNKINCLILKGKISYLRQDWDFMADIKINHWKCNFLINGLMNYMWTRSIPSPYIEAWYNAISGLIFQNKSSVF